MNFEGQNQVTATPRAIETVLAGSKPTWRPKVSGYVALLLGPLAGGLVAAASFRSMGQTHKARQTVFYTVVGCAVFLSLVILGLPARAPLKPILMLAAAGAGFSIFPSIVRNDYVKWKKSNPGVKPRNDYTSIGWGILGSVLYVVLGGLIGAGETIVRLLR